MDLTQFYEQLPDAVYVVDAETAAILSCNRAACSGLGYTREQLLEHSVLTLQSDLQGMGHWRKIVASVHAQGSCVFIGHHLGADGYEHPVEVHIGKGCVDGRDVLISVARDIRNRIEHLRTMQNAPDVWQGLHDVAEGVWDWQIDSGKLYFSPGFMRLLGYGPDEMHPTIENWKSHLHPEDAPLVLSALEEHLQGRRHMFEVEYRLRNRNGHYLWLHDRGRVLERDEQGRALRAIGMIFNLTDLKMQELALQKRADYDALTGLYNRRHGEEIAEQQLALMRRQRRPLGLALIDLDDFKQVNDLHGHLAGDQVLQRVADHINTLTRRSDVLFRWGGEEFVLLCPDTDTAGMKHLTRKLCCEVAALKMPDELASLSLSVSVGIVVYPQDADTLVDLVTRADSALYAAKRGGKNRIAVYREPCCCGDCSTGIG